MAQGNCQTRINMSAQRSKDSKVRAKPVVTTAKPDEECSNIKIQQTHPNLQRNRCFALLGSVIVNIGMIIFVFILAVYIYRQQQTICDLQRDLAIERFKGKGPYEINGCTAIAKATAKTQEQKVDTEQESAQRELFYKTLGESNFDYDDDFWQGDVPFWGLGMDG